MKVCIVNAKNGRMTDYTPAQLRKDAQFAVKGKGTLTGYWVTFTEGATAVLVAQYMEPEGLSTSIQIAI